MDIQPPNPKTRLHKYVGNLETYYETGMEGTTGLIFHDDRGLHPGPKWDNPAETFQYHSLEWSIWFEKSHIYMARIFDKENNVIYDGPLTYDRKKTLSCEYQVPFVPKEIETKEWLGYFVSEYRAELYTNEIAMALREQYKLPFDINERVLDKTTNQKAYVMNINLYSDLDDVKDKKITYWVSPDEHLNGERTADDLQKWDWQKDLDEHMKLARLENGKKS